jgi:ectoine hydroxylase-related dioxygenase (phytanoyl-CoA dioxygenase family)
MKTTLTEQQVKAYRDAGHLTIDGFLSPAELDEWRTAVDEAVTGHKDLRILGHDARQGAESYYDNVFIQRVNLWQDNPPIKKLVLDERIGKLACELEGQDGYRVWHDQALIKAPWANPTSFHIDNPYWSFSSKHAISIWVALDDATLENGCLYFIDGTHKEASYEVTEIGQHMSGIFKIYPQWKSRPATAVPMKAGSCSFHNGLIAHGAGPNMTPGYRRAMTCIYMPEGSTYNGRQNILTREQVARLKVGDPLNDDQHNPIVFSKRRTPAAV